MRAKKVDANQKKIVEALRAAGWSVYITSMVGAGYPDLTIGRDGRTELVEIKDGSKFPSQRVLTPAQEKFFREWKGSVIVINSIEDVLTLTNARM